MSVFCRWKAAGLDRMKTVPDSCTLKSQPGEDGSVRVNANFTMRPDPNMDSIIGQTAHNLDEVRLANTPTRPCYKKEKKQLHHWA